MTALPPVTLTVPADVMLRFITLAYEHYEAAEELEAKELTSFLWVIDQAEFAFRSDREKLATLQRIRKDVQFQRDEMLKSDAPQYGV